MRVPHRVVGLTRPSSEPRSYLADNASPAAFGVGVGQALAEAGVAVGELGEFLKERNDKTRRFQTLQRLTEYQTQAAQTVEEMKRDTAPGSTDFVERVDGGLTAMEQKFLDETPPELQDEFRFRLSQVRQSTVVDAVDFQYKQQDAFFRTGVDQAANQAYEGVAQSPDDIEKWETFLQESVDATDLSDIEKAELLRTKRAGLATILYSKRYEQMRREERTHQGGWVKRLALKESGDNPRVVNDFGYAGRYQMGAPRLAHLGVYTPGPDENLSTWSKTASDSHGKWEGRFYIPGFPGVKTLEDFLANEPAQEAVLDLHIAQMDLEISQRGLEKFIGTEVQGTTITRAGLYSMLHLGGAAGTEGFLRGGPNVQDANRTSLLDYAKMGAESADILDSDPRYNSIPYEDRQAIRDDADRRVEQDEADRAADETKRYNDGVNSVLTDILDGQAGQAAINSWREANPGFKFSDLERMQDLLAERDKQVNLRADGIARMAAGDPFDPYSEDDRDTLNAVVGEDGLTAVRQGDPGVIAQTVIPIVQRAGDVPTDVAGVLTGMTRSDNPALQAYALDTMAQIQDVNERAFDQRFNEDAAMDVLKWRARRDTAGRDGVLKAVRGGLDQTERQARRLLIDEAEKLIANGDVSVSTDDFDTILGWEPDPINLAWAAKALDQDFQTLFIDFYQDLGDVGDAEDRAKEALTRTWGVSSVGGIKTLMKHPPERFYSPFQGSYDWIGQHVREEFGLAEDTNFQLVADVQTRNEALGAAAPSYMIVTNGPRGWEQLMEDDGVTPLRVNFRKTSQMLDLEIEEDAQMDELAGFSHFRREYAAAVRHSNRTGIPIPDELKEQLEQWKARTGRNVSTNLVFPEGEGLLPGSTRQPDREVPQPVDGDLTGMSPGQRRRFLQTMIQRQGRASLGGRNAAR